MYTFQKVPQKARCLEGGLQVALSRPPAGQLVGEGPETTPRLLQLPHLILLHVSEGNCALQLDFFDPFGP